jgi:antitoxin (DNA-binding transcriptional repressor) of toxin-antitoxin stability system
MAHVLVQTAAAELPRLIERALAGEEIVLTEGVTPVVQLVPVSKPPARRIPGSMKGRFDVGETFFEPLPEHELAAWERFPAGERDGTSTEH